MPSGVAHTRVDSIEAILVDLPTIRPHQLAMTSVRHQTLVIVRLRCSDGVDGIGEATTIGGLTYGEESPEGIKLTIDTYLAPALIGTDATSARGALALMNRVARGNRFAKSALETALLDAQGKRLGVSVATLLGGAVTDMLPVLWALGSGDTGLDIEEAEALLQSGRHRRFKLKIGRRDPPSDVAHVAAVARALNGRAGITVDVNQAWEESQAKTAIAGLQDTGVELVEQPIAKHNLRGLARLSARFQVPIMADESAATPEDVVNIGHGASADIIALKIGKAGGLLNTMTMAAIAEASGMSLYGGTMLEGSIGTIASAHVFSTMSALPWGTELFGPLLMTDDIVTHPLEYKDGYLHTSNGPGLGVRIDDEKLEFYRRDKAARRPFVAMAT